MAPPRRRADDLTPKDDRQLETWLEDTAHRAQRARRRRDRFVRGAITFLAVFVVAGGLILAHGLEAAQDKANAAARMDRQHAFETCQLINDNARALNGLIDIVILRVQTSQLSPKDKAQAVALYERSKQSLPVCTKP